MKNVVIVVDEDPTIRARIMGALEDVGFDVWSTDSWATLPSLLSRLDPFCLIVAEQLAGLSGRHVVGTALKHWPDVETIILTDNPDTIAASQRLGGRVAPRRSPSAVVNVVLSI